MPLTTWTTTTIRRAFLLAALVALAGCQSGGSRPPAVASAASNREPSIVRCDKCRTTWVRHLDDQGHPVPFAYHSSGTESCAECAKLVEEYFASGGGGKIRACKTCGTAPEVLERTKS